MQLLADRLLLLANRRPTLARKAFLVNRIGDAGFFLGILLMLWCSALPYHRVNAPSQWPLHLRCGADSAELAFCRCCCSSAPPASRPNSAVRLAARRHGRPHPGLRADPRRHHGHCRRVHGRAVRRALPVDAQHVHVVATIGGFTALWPLPSRCSSTISNGSWPTPPSASSATCSWPLAWADGWPSSTSSPTPASRPCCSSVRARSSTP